MGHQRPQVADDKTKVIQRLIKHGEYIEHKFAQSREFDISAKYLQTILRDAKELQSISPESNLHTIKAIRRICASAISLYREPLNRPYFFEHLERLIPLLKKL